MRPGLLDGDTGPEPRPQAESVAADLGLAAVIEAMAGGDPVIAETARVVLLAMPPSAEHIAYRQQVLTDCVREPGLARELYDLAGRAVEVHENASRAVFFATPETLLNQSIGTLTAFLQLLRELRALAERYRTRVSSAGFQQFFTMVETQFGEEYVSSAAAWLGGLGPGGTLLVSARLGAGHQSEALVMRRPHRSARSLFRRAGRASGPSATYKIPYGDEAAHRALSSLQDMSLAGLADAVHRSAQHVLAFFTALRTETAFHLGSLNLRQALQERGAPVGLPDVRDAESRVLHARGLYDPGLQLRLDEPVVANDLDADGKSLIMVTGANRGGKSTFLRSLGLAQLMADAGTFVGATAFTTSARSGVFTHFTRDEDDSRTSGKFDEELRRISQVADGISPYGLLLCNESFQSTNEREGSGIARRIVDAMTDAGVTVVFVTHLHELAQGCYEDALPARFLRADRDRSFRLHEAAPEASSHGADLWSRRHGLRED
ncbi:hypothetical protein JIG36_00170 [Actinoplanes sp. LDG1-06]|uniref:DNA mismatch repair proteins mutS family domain-containing protein n=1 Tax=Paractinoplanes ovalisporus TaxID=2810368 RepID=A0ABS2A3V6_9ACTN|nr:hypothetical protein [Actinoplanes ovalisporus]MBM2613969.1 hypothetical protein [Actinoplanes ovalisporus]